MGKKILKRKLKNNTYENENMIHKNLRGVVKAVLRGKFMAVSAHIKKNKNLKSVN
jgi:hypothetical protein